MIMRTNLCSDLDRWGETLQDKILEKLYVSTSQHYIFFTIKSEYKQDSADNAISLDLQRLCTALGFLYNCDIYHSKQVCKDHILTMDLWKCICYKNSWDSSH